MVVSSTVVRYLPCELKLNACTCLFVASLSVCRIRALEFNSVLPQDLRAKVQKECKRLNINEAEFATWSAKHVEIITLHHLCLTTWKDHSPQSLHFSAFAAKAVDDSLSGDASVKALNQQLQRLDAVVAERVDAILGARGPLQSKPSHKVG